MRKVNRKIPVAILGATGTVGQKFITLLENHPQFAVEELVASLRSAGRAYGEAVNWKQPTAIPSRLAGKRVQSVESVLNSSVLFSGLDSSIAGEVEQNYASAGHIVISNSKNHRMDAHVPLVIPEINPDHFALLNAQSYSGGIVTNSNCSTMFLAMVLAALKARFTVASVFVSTMQAISGAGYPGVASMDILGNIVPYIPGEEEKLETEPQKILGTLRGERIEPADIAISAQCNRVPVYDGHTENISVRFSDSVAPEDVREALGAFAGSAELELHSAPPAPIVLCEEENRPQPALDLWVNKGMSAVVGRIRPCPLFHVKMTVLGHNTIRGAAGAAILNAEALLELGYLDRVI